MEVDGEEMEAIRLYHVKAAYSTLVAEELAHLVAAEYALPDPRVLLLRRGFNDNYRVTAGGERYILRIYMHDKYYVSGPEDLRFELDLLDHLEAEGVGVATALPSRSGEKLGSLRAPEGLRHYALFRYAPGAAVPNPEEHHARALGEALARLHLAADRFRSLHHRHRLDLSALIDASLERIAPYLAEQPDDLHLLQRVAERVRQGLSTLEVGPGGWGLIHGDPHTGNCHYESGRPILFDFDTCGYGWRAYDVGITWGDRENPHRTAFLEAYQSVRPLSESETAALPAFVKARVIWDAGDILTLTPIWGENTARSVIRRMFQELRQLEEEYPGH